MCLLFWVFLPLSGRAWRSWTLLVGGGLVWSAERLFIFCSVLPPPPGWPIGTIHPVAVWFGQLREWLFSVQCCSPPRSRLAHQHHSSSGCLVWQCCYLLLQHPISSRKLWYKEQAFLGWWFLSAGWMALLWTTRWWKRLDRLFVWAGAGNHDPSVSCIGHVFHRKQLVAAVEHSLHFLPKPVLHVLALQLSFC